MYEQRRGTGDEAVAVVREFRPLDSLPGFSGDWMRGGTHGEQVQHHGLTVRVPPLLAEAVLRGPLQGEGLAAVEGPGPFHAGVELGGIAADLLVLEIFGAGDRAAQQDRHVDRRDFRVIAALAAVHLHEVVEEAVDLGSVVDEELERPAKRGP